MSSSPLCAPINRSSTSFVIAYVRLGTGKHSRKSSLYLKHDGKKNDRETSENPVVLLAYVSNVSQRLVKLAGQYEVKVALSGPFKIRRLCKGVSKLAGGTPGKASFPVQHKWCKFVNCAEGALHKILISSANAFIGHTGKYSNDRLFALKYACTLLKAPNNLAVHCCKVQLWDAIPKNMHHLARSREKQKRKVMKACFMMAENHKTCQWALHFYYLIKRTPHYAPNGHASVTTALVRAFSMAEIAKQLSIPYLFSTSLPFFRFFPSYLRRLCGRKNKQMHTSLLK